MLDKAAAYQLRQAHAQDQTFNTNVSRNTAITPGATELREIGGGNAAFTQPPTYTQVGYTSPPAMREVNNAGLVRPTNGLGFEPDFIDCPNCQKRRQTVVKRVASETTRQLRFSYAMGSFPLLGVCGLIPDCMKMGYNTEHRCSNCNWKVAVMQHDQRPGNAPYVPSIYAAEV